MVQFGLYFMLGKERERNCVGVCVYVRVCACVCVLKRDKERGGRLGRKYINR